MLSVKIEFCPLDWYSSNICFSPTIIVLYNSMYIYKCFQAIAKSSKNENAINENEISSASRQAYRHLANDVIRFVTQNQ